MKVFDTTINKRPYARTGFIKPHRFKPGSRFIVASCDHRAFLVKEAGRPRLKLLPQSVKRSSRFCNGVSVSIVFRSLDESCFEHVKVIAGRSGTREVPR
jgi:hypothetical protein